MSLKRFFTSKQIQDQLLIQHGRCFWCSIDLNKVKFYWDKKRKLQQLRAVGDHLVPYSYTNTTRKDNLVVTCNVCNSLKSSKIFDSIEETKKYICMQLQKYEIDYPTDD